MKKTIITALLAVLSMSAIAQDVKGKAGGNPGSYNYCVAFLEVQFMAASVHEQQWEDSCGCREQSGVGENHPAVVSRGTIRYYAGYGHQR